VQERELARGGGGEKLRGGWRERKIERARECVCVCVRERERKRERESEREIEEHREEVSE